MSYKLKETAVVTAEDQFTQPISPTAETMKSDPGYGYLNVSVAGTFVASVELQRRFLGETAWRVRKTYTEAVEESIDDLEYGVEYRLGVPAGGFTSGSVSCRLGRAS